MKSFVRFGAILLLAKFLVGASFAAPLIPTTMGMTWSYNMTQEFGEGIRLSEGKPDEDGKVRAVVAYRLDGPTKLEDKEFLKFEMHRGGIITNTDLVTVSDRGIVCHARIDTEGEVLRLNPPQIMIDAPLRVGASWDFNGKIDNAEAQQHYSVVDEEDVTVPAGKFHAFHIHGEQTLPNPTTIDRWFAVGTGIVKDVTTNRSADGELLHRVSLELKEKPRILPRPAVKPRESQKLLSVSVGKDAIGEAASTLTSDVPSIYARWQGHGLRPQAKIRAVWIAENIGDIAPADYTIDEATTAATAPDSHGIFTLSKPEDGWAPGTYRVEFYVDGELIDAVKLRIVPPGRF